MKQIKLNGTQQERSKVLAEANLLQKLSHPNIIKYYHSFYEGQDQDCTFYILMEFAQCGDLSSVIQKVTDTKVGISEKKIWNYARMICSGLEHLHSFNFIHKDIKPQNILLTSDGILKLVDFGVSQACSAQIGSN